MAPLKTMQCVALWMCGWVCDRKSNTSRKKLSQQVFKPTINLQTWEQGTWRHPHGQSACLKNYDPSLPFCMWFTLFQTLGTIQGVKKKQKNTTTKPRHRVLMIVLQTLLLSVVIVLWLICRSLTLINKPPNFLLGVWHSFPTWPAASSDVIRHIWILFAFMFTDFDSQILIYFTVFCLFLLIPSRMSFRRFISGKLLILKR